MAHFLPYKAVLWLQGWAEGKRSGMTAERWAGPEENSLLGMLSDSDPSPGQWGATESY